MLNTSPDHLPQNKSLGIKQDDKFFCRLLSKENSLANPSFRVYYCGLSGAVPFTWESQPGTPKSTFSNATIPPLTPPPSYYSNSKPLKSKRSRSGLLHSLFPKIISLKKTANPLPSSSPMFLATSPGKDRKRSRFSNPDDAAIGSPTSILCFDIGLGKYR
ncbi:hypothetical protein HRI_002976500 [Hibiscus trionum]|uniref:Uncharacterized protein n=1 Tax=Hibiscus trionum TaxID=183268 RepID=A0A9W7IBH5_HIBTR|nr:hypothetical protein HRI_002976500 [Hibiscus trionum]